MQQRFSHYYIKTDVRWHMTRNSTFCPLWEYARCCMCYMWCGHIVGEHIQHTSAVSDSLYCMYKYVEEFALYSSLVSPTHCSMWSLWSGGTFIPSFSQLHIMVWYKVVVEMRQPPLFTLHPQVPGLSGEWDRDIEVHSYSSFTITTHSTLIKHRYVTVSCYIECMLMTLLS